MEVQQFEIWVANLSPQIGTESGKTRPVIVVQTDLLNSLNHPSTLICPLTTNVKLDANILRVHIKKGDGNIDQDCDVMIDHLRAIDNHRLIKKIGTLPVSLNFKIKTNITIVLDLNQ